MRLRLLSTRLQTFNNLRVSYLASIDSAGRGVAIGSALRWTNFQKLLIFS